MVLISLLALLNSHKAPVLKRDDPPVLDYLDIPLFGVGAYSSFEDDNKSAGESAPSATPEPGAFIVLGAGVLFLLHARNKARSKIDS